MPSMPIVTTTTARRPPLSSNPNAANSPLRGSAAAKAKRSIASIQREETYGQPPPLKKQMLEGGSHRAVRSPGSLASRSRPVLHVQRARAVKPQAVPPSTEAFQSQRVHEKDFISWQKQYRARFPRMVFFFDSVPDDVRAKLVKHIVYLGAREEKFFSIDVTHVVTTRSLPQPNPSAAHDASQNARSKRDDDTEEQPQTINPSLLDCSSESRRRMLIELGNRRAQPQDDLTRLKAARNNDVLCKARDLGKRIYTVEKLQRILDSLLEGDPYASKSVSSREQSRGDDLAKLLRRERLNGPSDRDPKAVTKELNYFRGPYIYVYDMDEKTKPIMVREYPKVADKTDGEWPQFKTVSQGRCPFVDESMADAKLLRRAMERKAAKEAAAKAAAATERESSQKPAKPLPLRVPGKRAREEYADPLAETKDSQNRLTYGVRPTDIFHPPKDLNAGVKHLDFTSQKFFTGRAGTGRVFAGEPVASGVQPSNVTSAIRSQVISSNAGMPGAKAGTSKELHNLQKKVLQKTAPAAQHNDVDARRSVATHSVDGPSSRATTLSRANSRTVETVDEGESRAKTAVSQAPAPPVQKSKKDMKPGYCENCMDKFDDFDEHVVSRKHRKFAECLDNWAELDELLKALKRPAKFPHHNDNDVNVHSW
ncbi:hypothetical protein jhhlp_000221 [Lomentospora prolificans]|uniref:DBF4-type domain-containing protein n=1 Tax=Lomentospora prolificans TaxID=41688 RepID=A0A2N3NKG7_9PEZI|nr:hypothetical protein jhhlp_000221 [Lomentospora prolificans]